MIFFFFKAKVPYIQFHVLNEHQMFAQGFPRCERTVYFDLSGMSLDNANQLPGGGEEHFLLPSVDCWPHHMAIYMPD